jgi:hypothetical protein
MADFSQLVETRVDLRTPGLGNRVRRKPSRPVTQRARGKDVAINLVFGTDSGM